MDALGYLTEYKYDAGGRLIETVRYSQRSPAAANMAAPVWIGVSNQNAIGGRPFEYRVPAYDADGDALSFSVVGMLPAWLSLDASGNGVTLKGTPPNSLTSYDVTVRASDGRGKASDVTLSITVVNSAPSWSELQDSMVAVNKAGYRLTLPPATDNESSAAQLVYSIRSALPAGLTFNAATRTLSGVPTAPGVYAVTARVADPQGLFTDKSFTLTVTNNGPTWVAVPNQSTGINQSFSFTVPAAVDPEGQALTYSVVSKPAWLTFHASTRVLNGTASVLGLQPVVLQAKDPHGLAVTLSFSVDVGNRAPTWTDLPPIVAASGTAVNYTPPPAVDPEGQAIIYSAVSRLPAGLVVDSATGSITGVAHTVGSFAVVLRAADPHGASVTRPVSLALVNTAPVYNGGLSDESYISGEDSRFPISISVPPGAFTDANGDALTYTATGMPGWLRFDAATRKFSGTVPRGLLSVRSNVITVSVDDGHAGTASGSFKLTVRPDPRNQLVPTNAANGAVKAAAPADAQAARAVDVLVTVRPTNTDGLHSYQYYDGQGRLVGSVNEQGFLSETIYDAQANKQQSVRYMNAVVVVPTDTLATLRTKAGSAKQITTIEYDGLGRVSRSIGVDGSVTRNEYDSAGRLVRQVSADGSTEQRASRTRYNAFGEVTGNLGGVGDATLGANPTQAEIDAAIASYGARGMRYDNLGQRTKAIDANNNPTWLYYDSQGRMTHTVNALGEVSETLV